MTTSQVDSSIPVEVSSGIVRGEVAIARNSWSIPTKGSLVFDGSNLEFTSPSGEANFAIPILAVTRLNVNYRESFSKVSALSLEFEAEKQKYFLTSSAAFLWFVYLSHPSLLFTKRGVDPESYIHYNKVIADAHKLLEKENLEKYIEKLKQALEVRSDDPFNHVWPQLAATYFRIEMSERAEEAVDEAIKGYRVVLEALPGKVLYPVLRIPTAALCRLYDLPTRKIWWELLARSYMKEERGINAAICMKIAEDFRE